MLYFNNTLRRQGYNLWHKIEQAVAFWVLHVSFQQKRFILIYTEKIDQLNRMKSSLKISIILFYFYFPQWQKIDNFKWSLQLYDKGK